MLLGAHTSPGMCWGSLGMHHGPKLAVRVLETSMLALRLGWGGQKRFYGGFT